jgi:RpiB/LacA/LacB family sugar-phosphate isomerase
MFDRRLALNKESPMRIAIASDHAGFPLKAELVTFVRELKHEAIDLGCHGTEPVDYPVYAEAVGLAIQKGQADRGILVCGSGVGASVAANKMRGIRCAVCHDVYSAHQGVEHDDMNVLALGARIIGSMLARDLVHAFLDARFTGEERHRRRLAEVKDIETRACKG